MGQGKPHKTSFDIMKRIYTFDLEKNNSVSVSIEYAFENILREATGQDKQQDNEKDVQTPVENEKNHRAEPTHNVGYDSGDDE